MRGHRKVFIFICVWGYHRDIDIGQSQLSTGSTIRRALELNYLVHGSGSKPGKSGKLHSIVGRSMNTFIIIRSSSTCQHDKSWEWCVEALIDMNLTGW